MSNDSALRVNLPHLLSQANGYGAKQLTRTRMAPVVDSKTIDSATLSLKSSSRPREFHLHLSNLDLDTTEDKIRSYVESNGMPVRILFCDIAHSERFKKEKASAAHVVINAMDMDKAFSSQCWPCDVVAKPWRCRQDMSSWHGDNYNF